MNHAFRILEPDDAFDAAMLYAASFDEGWSPERFRSLFKASTTLALGVEVSCELIGFVSVQVVSGEADIHTLAICPSHRRTGHALALLDALHTRLGERGVSRITLEVAENNAAGRALYVRAGYAEDGRRKAYYTSASGPAVDAILMSRNMTL